MHSRTVPPVRSSSRTRARPRIDRLDGFDPDGLAEVIRGGRFDGCPIGSGRLGGEIASIPLGIAHADAVQVDGDLGLRGTLPRDAWTALLIQDAPPGLRVNAVALHPGDLVLASPGARIEAYLPGSTRWLALQTSRGRARTPAISSQGEVTCFRPTGDRRDALRGHAADLLATVRTAPHRLDSAGERDAVALRLTSAMRSALKGARRIPPDGGACPERRRDAVRVVCDAMAARLGETLSVGSLSDLAGVSPRALAYYFQQTLGIAPNGWYRAQRFTAARRSLLRGKASASSVTATALRFGFRHLGRFSVEYRALFGESPSETLAGSTSAPRSSEHPHRRHGIGIRRTAESLTA